MTLRNSCPNRNSQITGCTTLNASTQGCRTRACSFLPVRYQVCARVVRNGTVLDAPLIAAGRARRHGIEVCAVAITCSPPRSRARRGFGTVGGLRLAVAAPGVPQVHVIERRPGHGHRGGVDPGPLQLASTTGTAAAPSSLRADTSRPAMTTSRTSGRPASTRRTRLASAPAGSSTCTASPCSSPLSSSGRSRGDDPAAVHDRELAGQPVRFLQVVRGQQHGHPLRPPASRAISCHMAALDSGSRPVVGSSRNSTAGRCIRPSATSSRRCMPPE